MNTSIPIPSDRVRRDLLVDGRETSLDEFNEALDRLRNKPATRQKNRATNSPTCPATLVYPDGEIVFVDGRKEIAFAG